MPNRPEPPRPELSTVELGWHDPTNKSPTAPWEHKPPTLKSLLFEIQTMVSETAGISLLNSANQLHALMVQHATDVDTTTNQKVD